MVVFESRKEEDEEINGYCTHLCDHDSSSNVNNSLMLLSMTRAQQSTAVNTVQNDITLRPQMRVARQGARQDNVNIVMQQKIENALDQK